MHKALIAALFFLQPTMALAVECPNGANDRLVAVHDWDVLVQDAEAGHTRIALELANEGEKGFRLIDATAFWEDALGERIADLPLDRDLTAAAGETFSFEAESFSAGMMRVPDMHPEDVVIAVCIEGIVFDDGEVVEYAEQR